MSLVESERFQPYVHSTRAAEPAICHRNHPSSTSTQYQHRRNTRTTLQNEKGYQAPSNGEETQSGHGEGIEFSGSPPPQSVTSSDHEREENEPSVDKTESDRTTTVSLPVCYLYPQRSPIPHRMKVAISQDCFFLIPNATRLFTTISRCLRPRKSFSGCWICGQSALANESTGFSREGRGRPAFFVSKASVPSPIFDVFGRVGGDHLSRL